MHILAFFKNHMIFDILVRTSLIKNVHRNEVKWFRELEER